MNPKPSNLSHDSALTHVTGKSEFIDDRALTKNELHVEIFYSSEAHAKIKKLDLKAALDLPGIVAIYTAKDFHHNLWGTIFQDQPLLADQEVNFVGEAIAIIASETREAAREAKNLIKITYEPLPAILSIDAAKSAKSFLGFERKIERGDVKKAFETAPHQLEGKIVIRGQDHFYLESQATVCYPKEDGQIEVHTSAQHPTEVQHVVTHGLGLPSKDVTVIVKRMGGGFGGKESQSAPIAAYAALVTQKTNRPARIILTKDDDMIMTGKRNPFENIYKVGFDQEGYILSLESNLFSDGGAYADLSTSIMERAMLHSDNAYYIPNMKVVGQVCKTNYHPHTAFRGFGGPKGVATIEKIIEQIAFTLKKDALDIRKINCYSDKGGRNITHYGQTVENNCLPRILSDLENNSNYRSRRNQINQDNQSSVHTRTIRGISLTPVKFGISFTTRFLNQANALVIVHKDGSLQVSTGATEMGQGVNKRIAQMVSAEIGLRTDQIRMMPTSTDKNANTSPTAASSGTDLNGAAALIAVRKIKARLSQLAVKLFQTPEEKWAKNTAGLGTEPEITITETIPQNTNPNLGADWESGIATYHNVVFEDGYVFLKNKREHKISFEALVNEAYLNRISLSDYAHYLIPGIAFNKLTGQGNAFLYFTQGAACSEVSIDIDTGEVKVLQVDILMDLGRPVNKPLDIGQVSGAFVQGMGWVTTEKLFYSKKGALLSHAPSTYKIPSIQDTPRIFNIELHENDQNFANVRGTKAVGEPPLLLGISVWTAITDAVKSFKMELPATQEEILRAISPEKFERWENLH
jgi:xanthine dehydrogenase large subunit